MFILVASAAGSVLRSQSTKSELRLTLRRRLETAPGSGVWRTRQERKELAPGETAIVICDMWNQHW